MVSDAPRGAILTRSRSGGRRREAIPEVPGSSAPASIHRWLIDALEGVGWLYQRSEEPRIDAGSVHRLYPSGPTEAQAESLRPLMSAAEFRRLHVREGRR